MSSSSARRAVGSFLLSIALLGSATVAHADRLVTGGRVVKVLNLPRINDEGFVLLTEGGTGACANGQWIHFYPIGGTNPEAFKRAYSAALLAVATGMRVDIEALDASCGAALFIFVYP